MMETQFHQVRNHQYDIGRHQYLSRGGVYRMFTSIKSPIIKVLKIHAHEEGCFKECGRGERCMDRHNLHFLLVKCIVSPLNCARAEGDIWVYHIRRDCIDWIFLYQERMLLNWMDVFITSQ